VSIRKISNKRLSRNLKTRKAPLRVLPMTTFHIRRRVKQNIKKQKTMENKLKPLHPPTIRCIVEEVTRTTGKSGKKSGRKGPIKVRPFKKLHFTMNALKWILLLIVIYLVAGMVIVMIQEGTELLKNIVIYSIIGFFTFFMGCIGWILARDVLEIVSGKKNAQNEAEFEV
jgi:hypothetical protein